MPVQKGDVEAPGGNGIDWLYDLAKQKFFPLGPFTVIAEFSEGVSLFDSVSPMSFGYVDVHGKIVIPKQFDEATDFEDGVALVRLGKQRGLIDHTGHFLVKLPEQLVQVDRFFEGLAAVVINDTQGVSHFGFINKSGKLVIPAIYYVQKRNNMTTNSPRFHEGVANVAVGDELHHQCGFIDKQGKWTIKPKFGEASAFEQGGAQVKLGPSGFNNSEWDNHANRLENFHLFLKQYALIGMSKTAIKNTPGKADHRYTDSDVFTLFSGTCGDSYKAVEIHYDDEKASKYRALGWDHHGEWVTYSDVEVKK
ncbi:MAG: WG repeat-containing protein [Candidatus Obscuribacterales bacterium]|nr:WG repeat-containing protein [Candidatus Obscuribacterales bacterium]